MKCEIYIYIYSLFHTKKIALRGPVFSFWWIRRPGGLGGRGGFALGKGCWGGLVGIGWAKRFEAGV